MLLASRKALMARNCPEQSVHALRMPEDSSAHTRTAANTTGLRRAGAATGSVGCARALCLGSKHTAHSQCHVPKSMPRAARPGTHLTLRPRMSLRVSSTSMAHRSAGQAKKQHKHEGALRLPAGQPCSCTRQRTPGAQAHSWRHTQEKHKA